MKFKKVKDSTKGTINEHRAINEFLAKGCMVSKNVENHGPFDIVVVWPNGNIELIDVKTKSIRQRDGYPIHRSLRANQKKLGVIFYYKDDENEGHYHPPKGVCKNKKSHVQDSHDQFSIRYTNDRHVRVHHVISRRGNNILNEKK